MLLGSRFGYHGRMHAVSSVARVTLATMATKARVRARKQWAIVIAQKVRQNRSFLPTHINLKTTQNMNICVGFKKKGSNAYKKKILRYLHILRRQGV